MSADMMSDDDDNDGAHEVKTQSNSNRDQREEEEEEEELTDEQMETDVRNEVREWALKIGSGRNGTCITPEDYQSIREQTQVLLVLLVHLAIAIHKGKQKLTQYVDQVLDDENKKFYGDAAGWLLHVIQHRHAWLITKKDVEDAVLRKICRWNTGNLMRLYRAFENANKSIPEKLRIEIDLHDIDFDQLLEQDAERETRRRMRERSSVTAAADDEEEEEEVKEETLSDGTGD